MTKKLGLEYHYFVVVAVINMESMLLLLVMLVVYFLVAIALLEKVCTKSEALSYTLYFLICIILVVLTLYFAPLIDML